LTLDSKEELIVHFYTETTISNKEDMFASLSAKRSNEKSITLKTSSPKRPTSRLPDYLSAFLLTICFITIARPVWGIEIIAFGDSITSGTGSTTGGYPSRLQQIIEETGKPCIIHNLGISGERTYQGVKRIDEVLDAIPADMILIMEGTNDIRSHHPWEITKQNLQLMIDKAKSKGVTPVLSTLTPSNQANSEVLIPNKYNPMIRELAEQNNIPLVDQYSAIETSWSSLTFDGIHPNEKGYLSLAETWNESIDKMISSKGKFISPGHFKLQLTLAIIIAGIFVYFALRKKVSTRLPSPMTSRKHRKNI
jgi:lysophospholipase L1-like esterase